MIRAMLFFLFFSLLIGCTYKSMTLRELPNSFQEEQSHRIRVIVDESEIYEFKNYYLKNDTLFGITNKNSKVLIPIVEVESIKNLEDSKVAKMPIFMSILFGCGVLLFYIGHVIGSDLS